MLNKIKSLLDNTSRPKLLDDVLRSASSGGEFILQENNFGAVHVELNLIRRLVERAAAEVKGINSAKADVNKAGVRSPLTIRFELALEQDFSVKDVSDDLVEAVKKVLQETLDISDVEIYVRVVNISKKPEDNRKRRVR